MEASQTAGSRARGALRSGGPLPVLALLLGAAGAVALVIAELSTVVTIDLLTTGTCEEIAAPDVRDACEVDGLEQHGGALIALGALALALAAQMAVGSAGRGTSAPAAVALIVIGAVAGALAARDFAASDETGLVGITFEQAEAGVDTGFYLELAGAGLCVAAGALGLLRPGRG